MGNKSSSLKKNKKQTMDQFIKQIDIIASNYILTQNFQDMTRLQSEQFCNKIIGTRRS